MCKVHTNSHEITNAPYVSTNYANSTTTVTADLTITYDAEKNKSFAEKIKVGKHNFESGANVMTANWIRILTEGTAT